MFFRNNPDNSTPNKIFTDFFQCAGSHGHRLIPLLFLFSIILLVQPAGCTVQFSPGDGVCGNEVLEENEMCDGSDFGGQGCSDWSSYEQGELLCNDNCKVDLSMCHTCGNETVEGPEECDSENLNGKTCESLGGEPGGFLSCKVDCTFDLAGCAGICGNNTIEEGETCDGENLAGETCVSQGFDSGSLSCLQDCSGFDTTDCALEPICGNDVAEAGEVCDGTDLAGETCVSQEFEDGTLSCLADCSGYDTSECTGGAECGDGVAEEGEACDGTDLKGETCESLGYEYGTLSCRPDCSEYYTSNCWMAPSLSWVIIPGGIFDMGSTTGNIAEKPVHSVAVPTFEMTETEVTIAQYAHCVFEQECTEPSIGDGCNWGDPGYQNHPVNCVTWNQARNYCSWVGGRLPSEAEWEYAARSSGQDITFPWGDDPATCDYAVMDENGYGCGTERTWEVCSKPAGNTNHGLCDMAGNVFEWLEDDGHSNYNGAPDDGSAWVDDPRGTTRIIRGGSFVTTGDFLRATCRENIYPTIDSFHTGFRCAR